MDIHYEEKIPDVGAFINLYRTTGWALFPESQFAKALQNSYFVISAYHQEQLIGIGRILSDGAMYAWIQDMIVHPDYQKRGIGSEILMRLLDKLKREHIPFAGLFCASGKRTFYEKHRFRERPDHAPGMYLDLFEEYPSL